LGLSHVILMGGVMDENPRARRVYEKLGFQFVRSFETEAGGRRLLNHDMVAAL
jgi:RimJ/RimL family protein N-acetyltransferase